MTKSNPKMILNVQFENEELDKQIQIAMDKYVEDLMLKNLDRTIEKYVVQHIQRIIDSNTNGWLNGKTMREHIREATNEVVKKSYNREY